MKDAKHSKVWKVLTIIFTLFHGQAAVERGFSVNSELLVDNLQEKTLGVSRFVYSSVKSRAGESESGHFWGFRSRSRQKLADSDSSKTLYYFFIKTIAGKVWFSSISRKFATEKEFIFNGKDAVCITLLPQQLDVRLYSSWLRAGSDNSLGSNDMQI